MELCLLHITGEFECFGVYFGRTYPKAAQAVFFCLSNMWMRDYIIKIPYSIESQYGMQVEI